jgi:hypothetical protein
LAGDVRAGRLSAGDDLEIVAAVLSVAPAMTDSLTIDGKAVTLVRIDTIPAAGTPVAYRFIVRG